MPSSSPTFPIIQLAASAPNAGANSTPIPCTVGDYFIFTYTIRIDSATFGTDAPFINVAFLDGSGDYLGSIGGSPAFYDNGWHIGVVSGKAPVGSAVALVNTVTSGLYSGVTTWSVSNYRITKNGIPQYAPLSVFYDGTTSALNSGFIWPLYYLSLLTSEYQQAPNLYAWLATLLQPTTDLIAFLAVLDQYFSLGVAQGTQLDTIGQLVGASRILPFQPSTGQVSAITTTAIAFFGGPRSETVGLNNTIDIFSGITPLTFNSHLLSETVIPTAVNPNVSITAVFSHNHAPGTQVTSEGTAISATLDDTDYLLLIKAKIAQNQWNGSIAGIYAMWNQLFPGTQLIFIDNQDMTCDIVLGGIFTPIQQAMILNDLIIPRPQAVLYNFSFAQLPLLGFDQNDATIAGLDGGHFV